jgi:hypothetical protein
MADNSYVGETTDDLFINALRDILAVEALSGKICAPAPPPPVFEKRRAKK